MRLSLRSCLADACSRSTGRPARTAVPVKGMVVSVNRSAASFTASIEEIPGFMRAMTMPFEVRQVRELDGLAPGAMVEFTLVVDAKTSYAERIRIVKFQNVEQDPFAASRLDAPERDRLRHSRQTRGCRRHCSQLSR